MDTSPLPPKGEKMIIPTLVLVSAMQFGDPQSGARIDDLSHSPWREVPIVKPVSYTAQSNDVQELPTLQPADIPVFPSAPTTAGGTDYLGGMPDPDLVAGNVADSNILLPPENLNPTPTISPRATTPSNGAAYGYQMSLANASDYGGTTRIENNRVYLSRAKVQFDKIAKLSAPIGGIVLEQRTVKCDAQGKVMRASNGEPIMIDLERGVLLFTGQQIAQLDDRYPQAQFAVAETKLAVAKKEAAQTIGIDYAKASLRVAESDYKRSVDIATRTPAAVTVQELELKDFKVKEARLQLEKATIDHDNQQESVKVQEEEVRVAQTQLDLRKVKTPFNGMVVTVVSQVGNYLRESDPIAEVAQLDKLKVVAGVDGNKITQEQVDKKRVTVTARNPGGQTDEFEGFVRYAAPSFKDQRREFEVEIEVDNRLVNGSWLLKEGDFVDVVIHL